ncbi:right-handed parallel beta-helix repeat-containing protein [Streptosporangium sp. NPDC049376]|uniref:right-handed parallel beta-helix repeat-containing protein n=1 Tax=Streptosporangium sp. NPDC049376 TaxID=3366192 RepID=UPI00379A3FB5
MSTRPTTRLGTALLTLLVATAVPGAARAGTGPSSAGCIPSGTETAINAALTGPGAQAVLCQGAVFTLSEPVRFTAADQELLTEGLPEGTTRATLRLASATVTTAVDGVGRSRVAVRNVQIDGDRPTLGQKTGSALVQMGGAATGQIVENSAIRNPRSWSALHYYEGAVSSGTPQCQGARITGNRVGPAGVDRPSGQWADGISLACGDSVVSGNTVVDATDGGIVIFGAPGSTIENNTVRAEHSELLGGINLVDIAPVDGNYTGTTVRGNVVDAKSAFIKVGMAMGWQVWTCGTGTVHGATVTGNTLRGLHMGYGYAVNGVRDWTVTGNVDESRHVGVPTTGCGGTPLSRPGGYQVQAASTSTLQPEFASGQVHHVLGVTEPAILKVGTAPTACIWFQPDEALFPGASQTSCDGRFKLTYRRDGDLVLTQVNVAAPLWSSGTAGSPGAVALMQQDGNFVIYDAAGVALWSTRTGGSSGARLAVQDDGNVVVYTPTGTPLWSTRTGGR